MSATSTRFAPGTFSPDPRRATAPRMVAAQARIESLLFLRHGEQQLLSLIIPLITLVALSLAHIIDHPEPVQVVFPLTLAVSAMSAGFTGQAIAVAFDRRYGALKRIGASGVPPWTIISGKVIAVIVVAIVQTLILGATALVLGWRTAPATLPVAALVLLVGVATFTALGLLVGGTLGAETVLALANLIWFVLVGVAGFAVVRSAGDVHPLMNLIPSVALADGLEEAFAGSLPLAHLTILAVWLVIGAGVSLKLFRFS